MTFRTAAHWGRPTLCTVVVGFATTLASSAAARDTLTIPECASYYTFRATIPAGNSDPRKQRELNRRRDLCQQKIDEEKAKGAQRPVQAAPLFKMPFHSQRPQTVSPPPNAQPVRPQAPNPPPSQAPAAPQRVNVFDLLNRVRRTRSTPPPASAPPPRSFAPAAPAAAPAAPPAAAPAAPAPAAPAPVAPVMFTPPPAATGEQRNIFGIQLGAPLELPACAPGVINVSNPHALDSTAKVKPRSVTTTCAQTGPSVQKLGQRMADAEDKPIPAGVQFALVRLASDSCPDWLSGGCTLSVATRSGAALGIAFLTNENAEHAVIRELRRKYNGKPSSSEPAACDVEPIASDGSSRRMGNDSNWQLSDLRVSYWSVNGLNCGQGRVLVQTRGMTLLFEQAMASDEAAQPKM